MNERIRDLQIQAFVECKTFEGDKVKVITDEVFERFAELIIAKCIEEAGDPADGLIKGNTWHDGVRASIWSIKQYFEVEESKGWVCPKCGVDRTKAVCPQGHMAAVEGKCPMIGVAQ